MYAAQHMRKLILHIDKLAEEQQSGYGFSVHDIRTLNVGKWRRVFESTSKHRTQDTCSDTMPLLDLRSIVANMLRTENPAQQNEIKDNPDPMTSIDDNSTEQTTDTPRVAAEDDATPSPRQNRSSTRRPKEVSDLKKSCEALEKEKIRLQTTLSSVRLANDNLRTHTRKAWGEKKSLVEKLAKAEEIIRHLEDRAKDDTEQLAKLAGTREKLTQVTQELDACRRQHKQVEALLEVRTSELRNAQACLGRPDTVADAEVQRIVEKLNSEMFQMSAQITDAFPFEEQRALRDYAALQAEYTHLTKSIGCTLVKTILKYSHSGDPILVQLALQAYLAERVFGAVKAWDVRLSGGRNGMLDNVYQSIVDKGEQVVHLTK